jgi:hypothetical protein
MPSNSPSLLSEDIREASGKDALLLVACKQQHAHSGKKRLQSSQPSDLTHSQYPWSRRAWKTSRSSCNLSIQTRSPFQRTTKVRRLCLLFFIPSNTRVAEWKIVDKAMMFLPDGTLVKVGDQKPQIVEVQSRVHKPGFRRFKQLPVEVRLIIWNYALPGMLED